MGTTLIAERKENIYGPPFLKTPRAPKDAPDARGILYRVPYFRRDQVILSLDRLARPTPAQEQVRKSYRRQQAQPYGAT